MFRHSCVSQLGDGTNTSFWYDNWQQDGPVADKVSRREIYESGVPNNASVHDVVLDGAWQWPIGAGDLFHFLNSSPPPTLSTNASDKLVWKHSNGKLGHFSVHDAWLGVRETTHTVNWSKWIWYSQCIPRHSFILWLAIRNRLRTHDNLHWDTLHDQQCTFCKSIPDSHDHLFFSCDFPAKVWEHFKPMARLAYAPNSWSSLMTFLPTLPVNRVIWSIVQRLTLGATVYFIWQERNLRMFQDKSRTVEDVCSLIRESVRLRLVGLKTRPSPHIAAVEQEWEIDLRHTHSTNL